MAMFKTILPLTLLLSLAAGAAAAQQTPFTPMPSQQTQPVASSASEQGAPAAAVPGAFPAASGTTGLPIPMAQTAAEPTTLAPAPDAASTGTAEQVEAQTGEALEYLPPNLDVGMAGAQPQGAAGGGHDPFIGVEFETLRRRVVALEAKIEELETLVARQGELIRAERQE